MISKFNFISIIILWLNAQFLKICSNFFSGALPPKFCSSFFSILQNPPPPKKLFMAPVKKIYFLLLYIQTHLEDRISQVPQKFRVEECIVWGETSILGVFDVRYGKSNWVFISSYTCILIIINLYINNYKSYPCIFNCVHILADLDIGRATWELSRSTSRLLCLDDSRSSLGPPWLIRKQQPTVFSLPILMDSHINIHIYFC